MNRLGANSFAHSFVAHIGAIDAREVLDRDLRIVTSAETLRSPQKPGEKMALTVRLVGPHQHHRDIVAPAILVSHLNQILRRLIEGGSLPLRGRDARILNHIGQTV